MARGSQQSQQDDLLMGDDITAAFLSEDDAPVDDQPIDDQQASRTRSRNGTKKSQ